MSKVAKFESNFWKTNENIAPESRRILYYSNLGSASDWLNQISHAPRPIRSTMQIWVVTRHRYGISALVSQETSFGGKTRGIVAKCLLFSQATFYVVLKLDSKK